MGFIRNAVRAWLSSDNLGILETCRGSVERIHETKGSYTINPAENGYTIQYAHHRQDEYRTYVASSHEELLETLTRAMVTNKLTSK